MLPCSKEAANSYIADSCGKGTDLTSGVAREMILSLDKEVQLPPHITEEETTEGMKTPVFQSSIHSINFIHLFIVIYLHKYRWYTYDIAITLPLGLFIALSL